MADISKIPSGAADAGAPASRHISGLEHDILITSGVVGLLRESGHPRDVYVIGGKRYRVLSYVTGLGGGEGERTGHRLPDSYETAVTLLSAVAEARSKGMADEGLLVRVLEREGFVNLDRLDDVRPNALLLGFDSEIDKLAVWAAREAAKKIEASMEMIGLSAVNPDLETRRRLSIRRAACHDCSDISDEELERWREDIRRQLSDDGPKRFAEAEAYLKEIGGGAAPFASWRSVSDSLKGVKDLKDWTAVQPALAGLEGNDHSKLDNIGRAARAMWLSDFARWLKGYVNKPLLSGLPGEIGKLGRWYEYASLFANQSFTDEKLDLPREVSAIPGYIRRVGGDIAVVYKAAEGDETANKAGLFTLGVGSAVAGIWLGWLFSSCILAGEIGGGVVVTELSWSARLALEARLLVASTAGFTAGSELVFAPIAGLPEPERFARSFGANLLVFGGLHVIGAGLSRAFGFSKAGDVMRSIEAGGDIPVSGRALNGLHAAIGTSSGIGIFHKALQFGAVFTFLEASDIPLSWTGLVSEVELKSKDNGLFGVLSRAAQLAVIILFAGRLRPGEAVLKRAEERAAERFDPRMNPAWQVSTNEKAMRAYADALDWMRRNQKRLRADVRPFAIDGEADIRGKYKKFAALYHPDRRPRDKGLFAEAQGHWKALMAIFEPGPSPDSSQQVGDVFVQLLRDADEVSVPVLFK